MFSYSGDPRNSETDALRFKVGDTTEGLALLQDEEIAYLLDTYATVQAATVYALHAMLARIAQDTLQTADGITRDLAGRRELLMAQLAQMGQEATFAGVSPFVGGTSVAERDSREENTELVQPAFRRGQFGTRRDDERLSTWQWD